MTTKLIFYENERGQSQSYEFIMKLQNDAFNGVIDPMLIGFVHQGLGSLELADDFPVVSYNNDYYDAQLVLENPKHIVQRMTIVKALLDHPIFEFRVDWGENHFRAIFFPLTFQNVNCYVFTSAFLKHAREHHAYDPTDYRKMEAKRIYQKFFSDPERYLIKYFRK